MELGSRGQVGGDFLLEDPPETSSTTRTQTELPFGGAAMDRGSTPPVAMAKLAPMSVRVDGTSKAYSACGSATGSGSARDNMHGIVSFRTR